MPYVKLWVALNLLLSSAPPHSARHLAQGDQAGVRSLVERFYAAYQREDADGLFSLWSAQSPQLDAAKRSMQLTFVNNEGIEAGGLDIKEIVVNEERATVRLRVRIAAIDSATRRPAAGLGTMNRTLELVREGGAWKVWRYDPAEEELAAKLIALKAREERAALLDVKAWLVGDELLAALQSQAREQIRQGRYEQALATFDAYLHANERVGSQSHAASISIGIGTVHHHKGDYERAAGFIRRGLELAKSAGDRRAEAIALNSLGSINRRQGRYDQALNYFKDSLRLSEEVGNKRNIAAALYNIGLIHRILGDQGLALEYFRNSLSVAESVGDKSVALLPLGGIAGIYMDRGDFLAALDYNRRRLQQASELKESLRIAGVLLDSGSIHGQQGNNTLAIDFFERGLRIAEEIGSKDLMTRFLGNLGNAYLAQDDFPRALDYHRRTVKIAEETGAKETLAAAYLYLGDTHAEQGSHGQALEMHLKALSVAEKIDYADIAADVEKSIAFDYLNLGEPQKALEHAGRASALAQRSGFRSSYWAARTAAGRALLALDRPGEARQAFLDAIGAIEKLRDQVAGDAPDRQRFFEDKTRPYEYMIQLSLAAGDSAGAFAYAERAKGRALLDVLGGRRGDINQAMTSRELEQDRALTGQIASLNTELADLRQRPTPDARALSEVQERLRKARLAYENFQTELYTAHPELKVRRGDIQIITAAETDRLLDDKTALIEYFVGESTTYLFVLTRVRAPAGGQPPVSLNVFTINTGREALGQMAEDFRLKVARRDLTVKKSAEQLFDLLIAPARHLLRNKSELCVVPDGPLWLLPFQALRQRGGGYLLEQYAVYYAPSLSVLREMEKKAAGRRAPAALRVVPVRYGTARAPTPGGATATLLAFGNPVLSRETVTKVSDTYRNGDLGPLPEAEKEVERIGQMYGAGQSKVLIREGAREEVVKAEAGRYRVLHFASHAILDDRNPMYSRILLSPSAGAGSEDGDLEAWEVMRLRLTADLAVLSGCETALGRVGTGEGMVGMSWAMFVADCPTVVASQWKVDSASTTEFMIEFHRNLLRDGGGKASRLTKAGALRQAALGLLRGPHNHPAYWAGFILIGKGR